MPYFIYKSLGIFLSFHFLSQKSFIFKQTQILPSNVRCCFWTENCFSISENVQTCLLYIVAKNVCWIWKQVELPRSCFIFMIFSVEVWLSQPVRCFLKMFSLLLLDLSLAGSLPLQKVTGIFSSALGPKGATKGETLCAIVSLSWFVYPKTLNLGSLVVR